MLKMKVKNMLILSTQQGMKLKNSGGSFAVF